MENTWVSIYKTTNTFEANALIGNLKNNNIPCSLLNKIDSSYGTFGIAEIRVPLLFEQQALAILQNTNTTNTQ